RALPAGLVQRLSVLDGDTQARHRDPAPRSGARSAGGGRDLATAFTKGTVDRVSVAPPRATRPSESRPRSWRGVRLAPKRKWNRKSRNQPAAADGGIVSGRYESLLARRRRRARTRRNLRLLAFVVASFAIGTVAARWRTAEGFAVRAPLPDVAATTVVSVGPQAEPPPPPPAPLVPPALLATLPPTVRGAVGSVVLGDGDRLFERVGVDPSSSVPGPLGIGYTLDADLTRRVAEILRPVELGHVVVLDPVDGRVLAYASTDPVSFPATRPYPPPPLRKVVTAAAVLERAPEAIERPCRFVGSPYYLAQNLLDPPPL